MLISLNCSSIKDLTCDSKLIDELKQKEKSGKNKFNQIAGINLDRNRFSELANLEGRFWDSN